jgi:hypothetical protein
MLIQHSMGQVAPLLIGLFLIATPTFAYTFAGNGTESCGSWTAGRRQGGTAAQQWVLGYIAGVAAVSDADPLAGTDAQGVWAWIDRYCYQNPTDQLISACIDFVNKRLAGSG